MRRFALALATLCAITGAACAGPSARPIVDCGPASVLVPHPREPSLTGAPLGPLLIRGYYGEGATTAIVHGFARGYPTKMLLLVAHDMDGDITLSGIHCGDGAPFRFWLDKEGSPWTLGPTSTPVPEEVMRSTGDVRAVLPRLQAQPTGTVAYGGYLLFTGLGSYRIDAFVGARKIGEATLVVTTEPATEAGPPRPADLALAPGERDLLLALRRGGIQVAEVRSSKMDSFLGPDTPARFLVLGDGAIEALFFPDAADAAAMRACGEKTPAGRYVYRLIREERVHGIDSAAPEAFIVSGNAMLMVWNAPELAERLRRALGAADARC